MRDQIGRQTLNVHLNPNCRVYPTPSSSSCWQSSPTAGRKVGGNVAEKGEWRREETGYEFLEFGAFSPRGKGASPVDADHTPSCSYSDS